MCSGLVSRFNWNIQLGDALLITWKQIRGLQLSVVGWTKKKIFVPN